MPFPLHAWNWRYFPSVCFPPRRGSFPSIRGYSFIMFYGKCCWVPFTHPCWGCAHPQSICIHMDQHMKWTYTYVIYMYITAWLFCCLLAVHDGRMQCLHAMMIWPMTYDLWPMTYDLWLMAYDLWPMAYDLWPMTYDMIWYDIILYRMKFHMIYSDLIHIHVYKITCMHTYIHTYIITCMHACIHNYIITQLHSYLLTYIHAYLHAYIHTIHTYPSPLRSPECTSTSVEPVSMDAALHTSCVCGCPCLAGRL